tara:strand:- start:5439 stop:5909 length:471 start_codon:yes stop_codon:yes gene_type:complete
MSRLYSVTVTGQAVTTILDLVELAPADDIPIQIVHAHVMQGTDFSDSAAEILRLSFIRNNSTSGSGGASFTPLLHDTNDAAAATACEIRNTTVVSSGTPQVVYASNWNIRLPWYYDEPAPGEGIRVDQSDSRIALQLVAAPADSLTMEWTVVFREI